MSDKWRAIVFIGGSGKADNWYEAEVLSWLHRPKDSDWLHDGAGEGWGSFEVGAVVHTYVDRGNRPHVYAIYESSRFFYQWLAPHQHASQSDVTRAARKFWREKAAEDKARKTTRDTELVPA